MSQRQSSPCSYLAPTSEDESAVKEYEAASELDTTTTTSTKQNERMKSYWTRTARPRQDQTNITTSSDDLPGEVVSKLPSLSREYRLRDFSLTNTSESPLITHSIEDTKRESTSYTSESSGTKNGSKYTESSKNKLSEISATELSTFQSSGDKAPYLPAVTSVPSVTAHTSSSTTTPPFSQPVSHSHSSGESSVSMPDMREVLRRFGIEGATSKSSSTTPSSEEEKK